MTFRLSTTDHVIPAGHRLGLIIGGTDSAFIAAPREPGRVDLGLAGTSVTLPVVGGDAAVAGAGADVEPTSPPVVRPERAPAPSELRTGDDIPRP